MPINPQEKVVLDGLGHLKLKSKPMVLHCQAQGPERLIRQFLVPNNHLKPLISQPSLPCLCIMSADHSARVRFHDQRPRARLNPTIVIPTVLQTRRLSYQMWQLIKFNPIDE